MSRNNKQTTLRQTTLSQNFLTGSATLKRIINLTTINKSDHVLEIGCGKGHITQRLLAVSRLLDGYELDPRLAGYLKSKFAGADNLRLHMGDFLKAPLPKGNYKVFSNIPFSITSDIVHKLYSAPRPPSEAWLIMEKGAAKRFMGSPRESAASLALKPLVDMELKYHFSRNDFHPRPNVDTVLLHFKIKDNPDLPVHQINAFKNFVKNAKSYGLQRLLTKAQISASLRQAGLPALLPSGDILYVQWLCLFRCYARRQ